MSSIAAGRVAVVIRHLDIAHLGSFDGLLRERGYEITTIDASDLGPGSVEMIEADLVVVLGGDMGAYQTDEYGYLVDELDLLAKRLENEKPTLGLCLGAQLIAHALGGRASKGKSVVIGFRDVNLTEAGRDSPLRHFAGVPVMQWHGDSFRLPAGATRLASSADYSNEAFRLGDYALAVQFHPELTGTMYEEWIAQGTAELARHGIDAAELLEQRDRYAEQMERAALAMLGEWLDTL